MCLSSSSEIIGRTEIGLNYSDQRVVRTVVTRASLRAEGHIPDWILLFRTLVRLSRISREISFNKGTLIPSRPVATFGESNFHNLPKVLVSRRGI